MLTDERTDALIRRLDVAALPDARFAAASKALLLERVRSARVEDLSFLGRARRDFRIAFGGTSARSGTRQVGLVALLALLLAAGLATALVLSGTWTRPSPLPNGPLVLLVNGELRAIDVADGSSRVLKVVDADAANVSRSPDGRSIAYWRSKPSGDELTLVGLDGSHERRLAANLTLRREGCADAWSPDSRFLSTADASGRIVVVDVVTGEGRFVTVGDADDECTLWSPDGQWVAFDRKPRLGPVAIALVHPDGTDLHIVTGRLYDNDAQGVNSWSPDGKWIYFSAINGVWRANVETLAVTRVTDGGQVAIAPALSPDGTLMSYIVDTPTNWDLYVANADGTEKRLVMKDARNDGWSADGRSVLARWMPSGKTGGLVLVNPDGSGYRLVVPEAQACPDRNKACDMDWGQAKP